MLAQNKGILKSSGINVQSPCNERGQSNTPVNKKRNPQLSDQDIVVIDHLKQIFPQFLDEVFEVSVLHESNRAAPLTADTLLQNCIDDLLQERTYTELRLKKQDDVIELDEDSEYDGDLIPYLSNTTIDLTTSSQYDNDVLDSNTSGHINETVTESGTVALDTSANNEINVFTHSSDVSLYSSLSLVDSDHFDSSAEVDESGKLSTDPVASSVSSTNSSAAREDFVTITEPDNNDFVSEAEPVGSTSENDDNLKETSSVQNQDESVVKPATFIPHVLPAKPATVNNKTDVLKPADENSASKTIIKPASFCHTNTDIKTSSASCVSTNEEVVSKPAVNKDATPNVIKQATLILKGDVTPGRLAHNQGDVTPARPAHNQGNVTPAVNKETTPIKQATLILREDVTPGRSDHNQGHITPARSAHNQGNVTPAHNQGNVTPAINKEATPNVIKQATLILRGDVTPGRPDHNQGHITQVRSALNQGNVTPAIKKFELNVPPVIKPAKLVPMKVEAAQIIKPATVEATPIIKPASVEATPIIKPAKLNVDTPPVEVKAKTGKVGKSENVYPKQSNESSMAYNTKTAVTNPRSNNATVAATINTPPSSKSVSDASLQSNHKAEGRKSLSDTMLHVYNSLLAPGQYEQYASSNNQPYNTGLYGQGDYNPYHNPSHHNQHNYNIGQANMTGAPIADGYYQDIQHQHQRLYQHQHQHIMRNINPPSHVIPSTSANSGINVHARSFQATPQNKAINLLTPSGHTKPKKRPSHTEGRPDNTTKHHTSHGKTPQPKRSHNLAYNTPESSSIGPILHKKRVHNSEGYPDAIFPPAHNDNKHPDKSRQHGNIRSPPSQVKHNPPPRPEVVPGLPDTNKNVTASLPPTSSQKTDAIRQPAISNASVNVPATPAPNPPKILTQEEAEETAMKLQCQEVLMLFPDVDPTYLRDQLRLGHNVNNVCNTLLENPQYPRKAKSSAPSSETTHISSPEDNKDYYEDYSLKVSGKYVHQCHALLSNDFKKISVVDIRRVASYFNEHYAPTRRCLLKAIQESGLYKKSPQQVSTTCPSPVSTSGSEADSKTTDPELRKSIPVTLMCRNQSIVVNAKFLKSGRSNTYFSDNDIDPELIKEVDFIKRRARKENEQADLQTALSLNEQEYVETGQTIECGCCYGDYSFELMVQCYEGHLFCKECLERYAKEAVFGGAKASLVCMTSDCDAIFPSTELNRALPSTILNKYEDRTREESLNLADMEDLVRCPSCNYAVILDPGDKVMACQNPQCMKETCRHCKESWIEHFGKRCSEMEKKDETALRLAFEEKMSQAKIRSCHRCKAGFMKSDGCNKMTCPCGAKMCYICRKPNIDYNHYCRHLREPGKGCTQCRDCSLWTDPKEDDERAVKEIKNKAQQARMEQGYTDDKVIGAPDSEPATKKQKTS